MKIVKVLFILLTIFFIIFITLLLFVVLPEYFACKSVEGTVQNGITIFGNKVDCTGRGRAFEGEFYKTLFTILIIYSSLLVVFWKIYKKFK